MYGKSTATSAERTIEATQLLPPPATFVATDVDHDRRNSITTGQASNLFES